MSSNFSLLFVFATLLKRSQTSRYSYRVRLHMSTADLPTLPPVLRKDGSSMVACHPEKYEALLDDKTTQFRNLLSSHVDFASVPLEVYESAKENFRMRANFNIWRDNFKDTNPMRMFYAMFVDESDKKKPCEIKDFPRGSLRLNELMHELMVILQSPETKYLHKTLFEIRFVTTSTDDAAIVLIYRCPLKSIEQEWLAEAERAGTALKARIIGRSHKVKLLTSVGEVVEETLTVYGRPIKYFQTEGAFSQPNSKVCEKMLEWACAATQGSTSHDLLELYCGGGTFTAALAPNFRRVLATEISKASVELAVRTFETNAIKNIKIARLSSEEFSSAYSDERPFHRLKDAQIDFKEYDIRTVLVDPPRAGLDPATCALLCRFDKIVYVSCNPETLARDVASMSVTHQVVKAAVFDQFPYTHHLESGLVLVKRDTIDLASTKE